MMAVQERGVRTISAKVATQTLKTELLLNVIGYHAHLAPCPMIFTQAKADAVKQFSKERLNPMARSTPVLRSILGADRQRGGGDTLTYREFAGGFIALESAGSPTNLAMRAARITLADEIDKYETTKEGDPVRLLEERGSTYTNKRLHLRCCSPTTQDWSRIDASYNESDMRAPFVSCPHCSYWQTLDFFRHVQWSKGEDGEHFPLTAAIYCESCGSEWTESQRQQIISTKFAIQWRQTRSFKCCGVTQDPLKTRYWSEWTEKVQVGYALCEHCHKRGVPNQHAGFTASKLYSPFITVPELAKKWLEDKGDPETKQTFYNTQLGLAFHAQILRSVDKGGLAARREDFAAPLPAGVLVLTAGIDVQAGSEVNLGRLEIEIVGWGLGEESWSVEHKVFSGDPARPEVWEELDKFLLQPREHELGGQMVVTAACIDTGGYNTEEAYKFARARMSRNIWAVKGASDRGGQWSPVWPVPKLEPRKTRLTGYKPVILGVNAAKEAVRQRLLIEDVGPGYAHFPKERADNWFDQLTSESLVIEKKSGFTTRKWELPKGRANEALDCRVYAYSALCGLYAVRKLNLVRRKALIDASLGIVPVLAEGEEPPAAPEKPAKRVRHSTWMQ